MTGILAVLCLFSVATIVSAGDVAPEKMLAKDLLKYYDSIGKYGRPVVKPGDPVSLKIDLSINKIIKTEKNFITLSGFFKMFWNDPFLKWSPAKYNGLVKIDLPSSRIWTPDMSFYNDFSPSSQTLMDEMERYNVVIKNDGSVTWIPRATFRIGCQHDGAVVGQKNCTFMIGSWVHSSKEIKAEFMGKADADLSWYSPTRGIEVISHSASRSDDIYPCCPNDTYTKFTYSLVVKQTCECGDESCKVRN